MIRFILFINDLFGSANTNRSETGLGVNCCQATHKHISITLGSLGPLLATIRNSTQMLFLKTCYYLLCKISCNLSYKKIVNNINGYENTRKAERYVYS